MSDTYFDLPSRLEDTFLDIESDIIMDLQSNNAEYAALHDRMAELKQRYPFIEKVLTGGGEVHLTNEEHAPLVEYLHLLFKREDMERRHIYFRGHTDAFAYLKKIHAI